MSANVVGLDIGSDHIRAVEVSNANSAKPTVLRFGEIEVPASAVRRGEVLDVTEVTAALKRLWSQSRFATKRVVLGIGGPRVLARDLSIPAVPLEHIRESLPFQVQDTLPMPVDEALLDFYPISQKKNEQGDMINGLLVAAVREAVLANVEAATRAGLRVVNVDFVPFALIRALASAGSDAGAVLYVSVGARTTNLVVAQGHVPLLVRILPIGGDDIDGALIKRFSYSPENARAAKVAYGMSPIGVPIEQQPLVTAMAEAGADLLASIRDTASYFQSTHPEAALRSVVFSGGGARLRGFSDALRDMSGIETRAGTTASAVQFPRSKQKAMTPETRDDLTLALGLAVGSGF